jgi:hypothetical protein
MKNAAYLLLFLALPSLAQSPQSVAHWPLSLSTNQPVRVTFGQVYTSALLRFPAGYVLEKTAFVVGTDTLWLRPDPHPDPANPAGSVSVLYVFRQPIQSLTLLPGTLRGAVEVVSLYAPPLPAGYVGAAMRDRHARPSGTTDCEKPTIIPVSVWRKGLAPPRERPTQTKVQFVIVHHSAGSNAVADYTEEVRNIYLQHTQVNGWNDVGYNFLLGRDAVVYEGRDGQGLMDGDNVLGAHFCGTNSGTMGICLMGNYNDVQPTAASITVLNQLIGWKLNKEGLPALGQALHSSSAKTLNSISGHRDGCATECPGANLYARLAQIRQEVSVGCSFTTVVEPKVLATEPAADWVVYPNPGSGPITVQHTTLTPEQVRFEWVDGQGRGWAVRAVPLATDRWQIAELPENSPYGWLRCVDARGEVRRTLWRYLPK